MASGAIRDLSRFLARRDTWIPCVDGHVVSLVVVRTVSLPDDLPPILPVTRCAINQSCVDMQEMKPCFVVTAVGLKPKSFMKNFERTVHANMHLNLGTRWLDKAAHTGPFTKKST